MNKTAIKNFAIWARRKLISEIKYKAELIGINENGILLPLSMSNNNIQFFDIGTGKPSEISGQQIKQREALVAKIKEKEKTTDYKTAYQYTIEEVAYTWFNRIIAIRFMEVNEYLPSGVRVLSSEEKGKSEPDIVTRPFDTDMEFSPYEKDRIIQLKDENKLNELFRMLFIKQCNKLNEILPELFEKTQDYSELLLTISFTDKEGILSHLVNDIPEDDFKEAVEIIGWMYQYYNEERKNEVINIYKGTIKKEDIPAATQLFTTDWVVRYMVDNSLGRYWIERNPQSKLKDKLKYLILPKNGTIKYLNEKITPEELTFFDPCMGSGHILVYAFDVLMSIYRECGFGESEAVLSIVDNNLFGLDIDNRAYQLSYFALMIKARSYDKRFFANKIEPNVMAIDETNTISKFNCEGITNDKKQSEIGEYLITTYKHAKELGSLLSIEKYDYKSFLEYLENINLFGQGAIEDDQWLRVTKPFMRKIAKQALIMSNKYSIVCTNPPYMNKLEGNLKKHVTEEYKAYSGDLFSVFIYKNFEYCKKNGYSAFMTPFVWMFIKTYEKLREYIINNKSITTLVQMEYSAFEEATVPICSFVLKNGKEKEQGLYMKLSEFKGGMEVQRKKVLEAINDIDCSYLFETSDINFSKIPGSPIAYWVTPKIIITFNNPKIAQFAKPCKGIDTGENSTFLRLWYEIVVKKVSFPNKEPLTQNTFKNYKWYPYNKGGTFRKWYGNNGFVINWGSDGSKLKAFKGSNLRNKDYYFQNGITWSTITSGGLSLRFFDYGYLFDNGGCCLFAEKNLYYILGLLNGNIQKCIMSLSPTINSQPGDIGKIPLIIFESKANQIEDLVKENIAISKYDWDSFETSWDFRRHPLLDFMGSKANWGGTLEELNQSLLISNSYRMWKSFTEDQFLKIKSKEEELNKIFIDIYELQEELTPEVEEKDVTVTRIYDLKEEIPKSMKGNGYLLTKSDVIKSFISYAIGCIFGRYSLDIESIAFAGGDWDNSKCKIFIPDKDNCIPITDDEYFSDDILGRFTEFVRIVYGSNTLEENLDFIAKALSNKGDSSREIIRNYFLNDFYKDHIKTYQKRPIYWLYNSGKQNGFKALIYMHRYNPDTTGLVRVDYLHKLQKIYQNEIDQMSEIFENSGDAREIAKVEKQKEKLIKQLKETKEYDEKIGHLALSRIEIDLDDGVKVNYEKVQTDRDGNKFDILGKI